MAKIPLLFVRTLRRGIRMLRQKLATVWTLHRSIRTLRQKWLGFLFFAFERSTEAFECWAYVAADLVSKTYQKLLQHNTKFFQSFQGLNMHQKDNINSKWGRKNHLNKRDLRLKLKTLKFQKFYNFKSKHLNLSMWSLKFQTLTNWDSNESSQPNSNSLRYIKTKSLKILNPIHTTHTYI